MTVSQDAAHCSGCGATLSEAYCHPDPDRLPCPVCGATGRTFNVSIEEKMTLLETLDMLGVRAGMSKSKGWFIRSRTATVLQRNRGGAVARHERVLDREDDRYFEQVTVLETGEIVHVCDEPLSQHRGHGSDKPKQDR
jgi:hypothetical protein